MEEGIINTTQDFMILLISFLILFAIIEYFILMSKGIGKSKNPGCIFIMLNVFNAYISFIFALLITGLIITLTIKDFAIISGIVLVVGIVGVSLWQTYKKIHGL